LVHNGATVNILPMKMVRKLGKSEKYLIETDILVTRFDGNIAHAKGVLPMTLGVGSSSSIAAFFLVDVALPYNALLGFDWIYANGVIPSSLHQLLIMLNKKNEDEVFVAENKPFIVNANSVEAELYKDKFGSVRLMSDEDGALSNIFVVVQNVQPIDQAFDSLVETVRLSVVVFDGRIKH
ncbi:hypothetical protein CFOL_v3_02015, partial [Cephalotus follicularis]